jgi:predicted hydrocarbon binding protein
MLMTQTFYHPNKMGRILLLSMEEVLSRTGLNAVLKMAQLQEYMGNFPPNNLDPGIQFEEIGAIHQALDKLYGPRGGRGLALRIGRACFKYGLHEFSGSLDLSFRLLPMTMKIKVGAEALATIFNKHSDQRVRIEESQDQLVCHFEVCPLCWQRETEEACCHLAVGLFQESLHWMSGGKNFLVNETLCIAKGDATCRFTVDQIPLE